MKEGVRIFFLVKLVFIRDGVYFWLNWSLFMVFSIIIDFIFFVYKVGVRINLVFIGWVYYFFCLIVYNLLCFLKIECRFEIILVLICFCFIKYDKN